MDTSSFVSRILIGLFSTALALAEPLNEQIPQEIPLDKIWGYNLPGTRDIRELEPKRDVRNMPRKEYVWGSFVNRISSRLTKWPKKGEKARPAFVVKGTGKDALKNADEVFLNAKAPMQSMPADTELSLVFFVHVTGWEVRIASVEKAAGQIRLKYQCVTSPQQTSGYTRFALIPLGKLRPGKVEVTIEQLPTADDQGKPARPVQEPDRMVCNSFSFTVE